MGDRLGKTTSEARILGKAHSNKQKEPDKRKHQKKKKKQRQKQNKTNQKENIEKKNRNKQRPFFMKRQMINGCVFGLQQPLEKVIARLSSSIAFPRRKRFKKKKGKKEKE